MRLRQRRTSTIDVKQPVEWKHPLNQGLVAWYLCHPQLAGTGRLYDLCNTGDLSRAGTLTSMAAPYSSTTSGWRRGGNRPGSFGVALAFDSTDDFVAIPSVTFVDFTLTAFVVPGSISRAYSGILGPSSGSEGTLYQSNAQYNYYYGGNHNFGAAAIGVPQHLALVNKNGSWTAYLNAVSSSSGSTPSAKTYARIGSDGFSSQRYSGQIDDVRFYNRALSAAEIAGVYQSSLTQYPGVLRRMRNVSYSFPGTTAAATDFPRALMFGAI